MIVPVDRASVVLVDYLSNELDKVTDPVKRWGYKFAVGAMAVNQSSFMQKAADLGVLTESGCIDTDAVRNGLTTAFAGGNTLNALGLTFSQADGERLVRLMEQ